MISLSLTLLIYSFGQTSTTVANVQYGVCEVYGKMYVEKSHNLADYSVYVEDSEAFADIIVFSEENSLYADQIGHWSFVNDDVFADFRIYFESDQNLADFSIYFTEYESFARCNR